MPDITIRLADPDVDASACAVIYAPYVRDTIISFEEVPPSSAQMAERMRTSHVWLIAETGGAAVGYAYASRHAERAAYRFAADAAIYLSLDQRGHGVGRALYRELIQRVTAAGFWRLYGGVSQPNEASNGLHEALGFEPVGTYRRVGWKQGAWHDVLWYQLDLRPGDRTSPVEPS